MDRLLPFAYATWADCVSLQVLLPSSTTANYLNLPKAPSQGQLLRALVDQVTSNLKRRLQKR